MLSRPRLTLGRDSVFRKCRSEPKLEAHELMSKRSVPSHQAEACSDAVSDAVSEDGILGDEADDGDDDLCLEASSTRQSCGTIGSAEATLRWKWLRGGRGKERFSQFRLG